MGELLSYIIIGISVGAAYSIAASGLVLTYTTTRVFNIAHGAFGMIMAYLFWEFSISQGYPVWLSLIIVLGVIAPATGFIIQRFIARGLGEQPVSVSLVVTVGMFVGLIGLAQAFFPPDVPRTVPFFFQGQHLQIGQTFLTGNSILTIVLAVVVAVLLYALLALTRIGTAMRASVDNPELLRLFGGRPDLVAGLSWAIGIQLAALAGILLAPQVGLNYYNLTLLVINAYAAAMLGRLKSLPYTFVGAIALGITTQLATGYLPSSEFFTSFRGVVPSLFLFVLIIALPQAQLRIGQVKGSVAAPVPSRTRTLGWGAAAFVVLIVLAGALSEVNLLRLGTALVFAIIMLSLVLLTGYGGSVSLAQLSFAGVGALFYCKLDQPNLVGLVIVVGATALLGVIVALPVIRLTGLFLALATLAFGQIVESLVLDGGNGFGYGGVLSARPLSILGKSFNSLGEQVGLLGAFFVLVAFAVLALRRGIIGRLLIAQRDSPAACGTLGLDTRWFRVVLFAGSAAIAGLAGALFASLRGTIGASDFMSLQSLPLLLLAVVFGVTSVTGATLAGVGLMLLTVFQPHQTLEGVLFVIIAVGAITLGRDPNGIANLLFRVGRLGEAYVVPRLRAALPAIPGREVALAGDLPLSVMSAGPEDPDPHRSGWLTARFGRRAETVHDHTHDFDPDYQAAHAGHAHAVHEQAAQASDRKEESSHAAS